MTRVSALLIALVVAAAPLSATAQDRGRFDGGDRRTMSVSEAEAIARRRAPCVRRDNGEQVCAHRVGYYQRGNSHVFVFELDGRVTEIAVDAGG